MRLRQNFYIIIFGLTEIGIGTVTLGAIITSLLLGKSTKPLEVFIFIFATSVISLSLGIGILKLNLNCYNWLILFAAVVILSKILIFGKIITLNGALETSIPPIIKNIVSIIYHSGLIWCLRRPSVARQFSH